MKLPKKTILFSILLLGSGIFFITKADKTTGADRKLATSVAKQIKGKKGYGAIVEHIHTQVHAASKKHSKTVRALADKLVTLDPITEKTAIVREISSLATKFAADMRAWGLIAKLTAITAGLA
ncbi:hypothetical protein HN446_02785 [bacterium]|jgi:hypothetical protein|nr:hypothetical protein [bacterium]